MEVRLGRIDYMTDLAKLDSVSKFCFENGGHGRIR